MQRDTKQRRAIREIFARERRPLTTSEVLTEGQRLVPSLGIATVYRTINSLSDEGWIHPVDLPGEPPRYERCGKPHHHHFICRGCGLAFDVAACPADVERLAPPGFAVDAHELVLYGHCPGCRQAKG